MNLYFDNGATSFPKPLEVSEAISQYLNIDGAPYGRSFYNRAFTVSTKVEECRDSLANLLSICAAERLTFTPNATTALNWVLKGFNYKYKKVLISPLEHNAVMRPLNYLLETLGINFDILPSNIDGSINIKDLRENRSSILKEVDLVIISHVSNVNGVIQPLKEIKEIIGNTPLLVDAAQSAGHEKIDVDGWNIDFLAITGHKSLLGPTGTGALYISKNYKLPPFIHGGTGSNSESLLMPGEFPDINEAGTPNIAGIYGLSAALEKRPKTKHSKDDFINLIDKVSQLKNISIYKSCNIKRQSELFSITHKNIIPSDFAYKLYNDFGIETRVGLHCAPFAHNFLKTSPYGTVRISLSPYHSREDLEYLYDSIASYK